MHQYKGSAHAVSWGHTHIAYYFVVKIIDKIKQHTLFASVTNVINPSVRRQNVMVNEVVKVDTTKKQDTQAMGKTERISNLKQTNKMREENTKELITNAAIVDELEKRRSE